MKLQYYGFLSNCSESVLKITLLDGYKITALSQDKVFKILGASGSSSMDVALTAMDHHLKGLESNFYYAITAEKEIHLQEAPEAEVAFPEHLSFFGEAQKYGNTVYMALKLFGNGNIALPLHCLVVRNQNSTVLQAKITSPDRIEAGTYEISSDEVDQVHEVLTSINFPFKEKLLQTAFRAYELSFTANDLVLEFISCMVAVEILLNKGDGEVSYTVSRNFAVLVGINIEQSRELFEEMRRLYRVRSQLAHGHTPPKALPTDLLALRDYVRKLILAYWKVGAPRDDLLKSLTEKGFNQHKN